MVLAYVYIMNIISYYAAQNFFNTITYFIMERSVLVGLLRNTSWDTDFIFTATCYHAENEELYNCLGNVALNKRE